MITLSKRPTEPEVTETVSDLSLGDWFEHKYYSAHDAQFVPCQLVRVTKDQDQTIYWFMVYPQGENPSLDSGSSGLSVHRRIKVESLTLVYSELPPQIG